MKIAYVVLEYVSPSQTFVSLLVQGLRAEGNSVRVFASSINGKAAETEGDDLICMKRRSFRSRLRGKIDSVFGRILGRDLGSRRYSRSLHSYRKDVYPSILDWNPDIVYCDFGTVGVLLSEFSETYKIPLVVHFHGYDATQSLREDVYRTAVQKMLQAGATVIVPSEHIKRRLRVAFGHEFLVNVIPCVPSQSTVRQSVAKKLASNGPNIVAVGRLVEKKSPLVLIETFRLVHFEYPDAIFHICGDGGLKEQLSERIDRYNLSDSVVMYGPVEHEKALELIANSDVFVQHSVTSSSGDQEGLPVSVMEAVIFGKPVVSTFHAGIPEVIESGVNGLLVAEYDFEQMARAICSILSGDAKLDLSTSEKRQKLLKYDRVSRVMDVLSMALERSAT